MACPHCSSPLAPCKHNYCIKNFVFCKCAFSKTSYSENTIISQYNVFWKYTHFTKHHVLKMHVLHNMFGLLKHEHWTTHYVIEKRTFYKILCYENMGIGKHIVFCEYVLDSIFCSENINIGNILCYENINIGKRTVFCTLFCLFINRDIRQHNVFWKHVHIGQYTVFWEHVHIGKHTIF